MVQAIRQEITVSEDNRIEIHSPILKAGTQVEVIVLLSEGRQTPNKKLSSFMGIGKGSFGSAQEADIFIRGERDKWE